MGVRRYVVVGGGAVGGALAAQLAPAGHPVVLVARGEHGRLVAEHGLRVRRPGGTDVVRVPVAAGPDDLRLHVDDVLLLAVKAQDAEAALAAWAWQPLHDDRGAVVGTAADLPIVTYQNGMVTEDLALRRWERVYAATIGIAASFLTPGEIVSPSLPPTVGLIWLGRHAAPPDELQEALVADLVGAGFAAWSVPDSRACKAAKLAANVANGLDLLEGDDDLRAEARARLRAEALAVLAAAGIAVPPGGKLDHHGVSLAVLPVPGHVPGRLSTWQSFARGASSEVDYLNGEIVLLARRSGTTAPLSSRLQQLLSASTPAARRHLGALLETEPAPAPHDVAV
ncbi:2-dehydropantoate 2-reductase N-terminal domain-containing protein [Nocardioides sp. W7]|uniref:ketopantoate reductase family protein n=1 Tax=Nocardioides sp. W7 TaxID=2931390 RepID=UPI001FD2C6C2|nr:2-dehydropantoate 2-reductase N-terminal domain-containing protein [Nocardioides sp. W7]